jgi:hypothetical protein
VLQEKWKGRAPYGFDGYGGTTVMGWGFDNVDLAYDELAGFDVNSERADEANKIATNTLIDKPFFRISFASQLSSTLFDSSIGGVGSKYAGERREWLLGYAIPALTTPAGGHKGDSMGTERFIDSGNTLNMDDNKNGWPTERSGAEDLDWLHSDINDVAFPFTYNVVEELLIRGGLM